MQNDLPLHLRGSCASTENRQEELELLDLADTVLADNNWRWLHHLLDLVHDIATRQRGKMYFARLFKSQDAAEIEVALSEMETWRQELGDESARPREHDLARALFLLGYDKSLSLTTL
ncbi:hypothetical protein KXD40_009401 [Peronospora effusa]|uniref:Uncharacterized protein n=1 Tax=Peronospora effusa TaxID=542832 RepID=A0A3M6VJW8_9STRA|nr:hypothetical protein DD238_005109 [Peronospora effusa]RQM15892.1 hypothetical protein DD237_005537 [Peronospora effusa]UIZ28625.1 hypothetical protein KXD40_009401 [Peronospora effusa]CAI5702589.1 unnamed protein product [Peronospora effusa]